MGTNIEAVNAIQAIETIARKEVICIFCGLPTPVPAVSPSRFSSHFPRRSSIIRCKVCGKEATYGACDTFEFDLTV